MIPSLLCASLEVALNRYLALEPSVLTQCAALAPRAVAVSLRDLGWTLRLEFMAGGLRVLPQTADLPQADARLSTSGPALLALLGGGGHGVPAGVQVEGDTELLMRLRSLFAAVGGNLDDVLAPLLGETAAYRIGESLRGLFGFGRRSAGRMAQNTVEYLTEESPALARPADVDEWMDDVDALLERVDRLEARLAHLETPANPETP